MARIRVALDNFFDESPTNLTKYLEQQMHFKAGFDKKQEYIPESFYCFFFAQVKPQFQFPPVVDSCLKSGNGYRMNFGRQPRTA